MTIVGAFKLWGAGLSTLALPLKMLGIKLPFVGKGAKVAGEGLELVTQKSSRLAKMFGFLKSTVTGFAKVSRSGILGVAKAISFVTNPAKRWYAIGSLIGNSILLVGKSIMLAFSLIKGAFLLAFSPVTLIVAGLTALIALAWKFREQIAQFVGGAIKGFTEFGLTFEPIKAALSRIWDIFSGLGTKLFEILGISDQSAAGLGDWSAAGEAAGKMIGSALQFVIEVIGDLLIGIGEIAGFFGNVVVNVIGLWADVIDAFTNDGWLAAFGALFSGIGNILSDILHDVKVLAIKTINWLIEKFNKFTGTEFSPIEIPVKVETPKLPPNVQAVNSSVASFSTGLGTMVQNSPKIGTIPQSAQPKSYAPNNGKSLTNVVSSNSKTVTNNINVYAQTNASANDIARTIKERQQMG